VALDARVKEVYVPPLCVVGVSASYPEVFKVPSRACTRFIEGKEQLMATREELSDLERAVSDVIDEILGRHHGIFTSQNHAQDFLDWLQERGYLVVPVSEVTQ
jgi:hypothetical protein